MLDYDYIIIGSGFGGSVAALRLAEKGYNRSKTIDLLSEGLEMAKVKNDVTALRYYDQIHFS